MTFNSYFTNVLPKSGSRDGMALREGRSEKYLEPVLESFKFLKPLKQVLG